jgi:hypothetical protein
MPTPRPHRNDRQKAKEEAVKNAYEELAGKRDPKTKVRIYSHEYCIAKVAEQFFYQPGTVENIVNGWGNYKRD